MSEAEDNRDRAFARVRRKAWLDRTRAQLIEALQSVTRTQLIEELQSATEPSRELDDAIETVVFYAMRSGATPHYTSSLDAARSLVPPGHDWIISRTNGGLTIHACCGSDEIVWGETEPMALCAAALKERG